MAEFQPLLKKTSDAPSYSAASEAKGSMENEAVEALAHDAESEVDLHEIVMILFCEWRRNGADEHLTPQCIMAMHLEYRRLIRGRTMFHPQNVIVNRLADAMLSWKCRSYFNAGEPYIIKLRRDILRNLRENWESIINFDENLGRNLNVYRPPTCRQRIQNACSKHISLFAALLRIFSHFACQLLLIISLLGWPLSLFIMGAKFVSQCPVNNSLPKVMVIIGLLGIVALLWRLLLVVTETWCWFSVRNATISHLWIALKFLELVFLLPLTILLWMIFEDSPSFDPKDANFCNETFVYFMFWMKPISTAFTVVWTGLHFVKAAFWLMRIQYHYMPPFLDYTEFDVQ